MGDIERERERDQRIRAGYPPIVGKSLLMLIHLYSSIFYQVIMMIDS